MRKKVILTFCFLYLAIQAAFIVKAHFSPDKRFGFWMFAETSEYTATLYRITKDGTKLKTKNGRWRVRTEGRRKTYSWDRFVRDYRLYNLESNKRAKGSMSRTLKFLDAALDFVADRIPDDQETRQLVLEITYSKAGNEPQKTVLESKVRNI